MFIKRKRLIYRIAILCILAFIVIFTLYNKDNKKDTVYSLQGKPAINFKSKTINNEEIELNKLADKKIIVNFWASWCQPCRREMPAFEEAYSNNKDKNFNIIAVNVGDSDFVVNQFTKKYNLSFPILGDKDTSIQSSYKVINLPTTFLINSNGIIEKVHEGEVTREMLSDWL
ncbi:thiol-disulfide oxidoreductase ResA [Bacillus sp. Bva_UNVM-123]|uniref:thiol-disulfide oxidoreductase ResA n=1 Tax=Bacillus sp. Bva_UNVM-123 TaxID=2829798 RepID=UPI00391F61E1